MTVTRLVTIQLLLTMCHMTEAQEALGVIACLDERTNLERHVDAGGINVTIIHMRYGERHLYVIERFVQDIQEGGEQGFVDEVAGPNGMSSIRELLLGKRYYGQLNVWLQKYSDLYRYSSRVELFYGVCKDCSLLGSLFRFGEPGHIATATGWRYMDVFNQLIAEIRTRCQSREFRERGRLRVENAERNKRNVLAMEEAMFSEETGRSRWLVLSLTLRYKPAFRASITPEIIQQHRDRFFAARRFNALISGIKNYVWTIEQGEETGLHLHVILFYSADHNHDEFIAQQIGEYWAEVVTDRKGDYWNSNAAWLKAGYEKRGHGIGVGQINWKDAQKREALRKNLVYLAKAEQYVMLKEAQNMHTFGMGQVPRKAKAGRPRMESGVQVSEIDGLAQESEIVKAE